MALNWNLQEVVVFTAAESEVYVTEAKWNPAGDSVAVAGTNGEIKIYNWSNRGATLAGSFARSSPSQTNGSSAVTFCPLNLHPSVVGSAYGNSVTLWDIRSFSNSPCSTFSTGQRLELLALDFSQNAPLVSATSSMVSEASVFFWDFRSTKKLANFNESHNDDITQVHFHPKDPTQVVSSSEDGLISLFVLRDDFNEEESLESVMNTGQTVSKIGYFGPNSEYLYCSTNVQTLSIWNPQEAVKVKDYGDLRAVLSDQAAIDYIIDCHYDSNSQNLLLSCGTFGGDIEIFNVKSEGIERLFSMKSGHNEVVRSMDWNQTIQHFVSVGEDSKVCFWANKVAENHEPKMETLVSSSKPKPYNKPSKRH